MKTLEKSELESIQQLRREYDDVLYAFGALAIMRREIESTETECESKYRTYRENEAKLIQNLKEKYGEGEIDLNEGVFRPAS